MGSGWLRLREGPSSGIWTGAQVCCPMSHVLSMPSLPKSSLYPPGVRPLSSERLGKLPKNTQLVSGRTGLYTQILWASELVPDLV